MKPRFSGSLVIVSLGLIAYIVYIYFIGVDKILNLLFRLGFDNISIFVFLAVAIVFFHSLSWYALLREADSNKLRFREVFSIVVLAFFSGYIIPIGAATEIVRAALLVIKRKIKTSIAVSSIIIHRIFTTSSVLLLLLFIIILRFFVQGIYSVSLQVILLVIIYALVIVLPNIGLLGFFGSGFFKNFLERIRVFLEKRRSIGAKMLFEPGSFVEDFSVYTKKSLFSLNSLLSYTASLIEWVLMIMSMFLLIYIFTGLSEPFHAIMTAIIIQMIYWILPLSFISSIGVADFIMTLALQVVGLSPYLAASLVIFYRAISFLTILIMSYPAMRSLGIEDLEKMIRESIKTFYDEYKKSAT